ncbi:MAG: ComEC/Rec2 family competence protein [Geminicoccaceae bacterium]
MSDSTIDIVAKSKSFGAALASFAKAHGDARFLWQRLAMAIAAQRVRWILWTPVAYATGIACYLGLPFEPSPWLGAGAAGLLVVAWQRWGQSDTSARILIIAVGLIAAGFVAAQWQARLVQAPMIERAGTFWLEGRVMSVEPRTNGHRVVLDELAFDRDPREGIPDRVRVSARDPSFQPRPGDRVRLRARLLPPSGPLVPGGFDFRRWAYFQNFGAVGYAMGGVETLARDPAPTSRAALDGLRQRLFERVTGTVDGPAGGVAAALLTGLRGAIPDDVWLAMQGAGLAHLLAISGLHLGLIAGTTFVAIRGLMTLSPSLALNLPIHKVAAAAALVVGAGYMALAGATVPTQRAFLMTAIVLVGVMLEREPLSLRLVALAALLVLTLNPYALTGASFQMSFAAVTALVAVYERWRLRALRDEDPAWWHAPLIYVLGVAATTFIASAATTPFAAYHFQRVASYGVLANLLAVPLTAFWIMPAGLAALLLMPLGLEALPLWIMGQGVAWLLDIAAVTSALPGAYLLVKPMPLSALVLFTLTCLWMAFFRGRLPMLAAPLLLPAILWWVLSERAPILIHGESNLAVVNTEGQGVMVSDWSNDGYVVRNWQRYFGVDEVATWPEVGDPGPLRCDYLGCALHQEMRSLALARTPEALLLDCERVELVVNLTSEARCPYGATTVTRREIMDAGGIAVRPDEPWTIEPLDPGGGHRLWTRR